LTALPFNRYREIEPTTLVQMRHCVIVAGYFNQKGDILLFDKIYLRELGKAIKALLRADRLPALLALGALTYVIVAFLRSMT